MAAVSDAAIPASISQPARTLLVVSASFPPAWSWGGPVRSTWNMCRGLARAGARVRVLTTNADLNGTVDVPPFRVEEGVEVLTRPILALGGPVVARYGVAPGLVRLLGKEVEWADLCVLQGPWTFPTALGSWICHWKHVPYVLCPRGTLEELSLGEKARKKKFFLRFFGAGLIRNAIAIQYASHVEQQRSAAAIGDQLSFVCENAIDPGPRATRDPGWLKRRVGIPDTSVTVGLAGRVHPRKGFDVIIPALPHCEKPVHLVSFGENEGDFRQRVDAIAREHGVAERVHFLGTLDGGDLQKVYASIDLLVLASLGESFGNVAIEALAQGTPVLVSEAVPVGTYVEQTELGAIIPGTDPKMWAGAMDRWISDEVVLGKRDNVVRRVRADFDVLTKGSELLRAYNTLLADRSAISVHTIRPRPVQ